MRYAAVRAVSASLLAALLLAVSATALGQQQRILRADIDYRVIHPQPVQVAGGIEVIDFFWYGCPYCNKLQPFLERWIKNKPADVTVRRIPVVLRDSWAPHARIYYTLEALGEVERLHQRVYHGYHVDELHMSKPEVMSEWAVRNGIDRARWDEAYGSADVKNKVEEARKLTRAYDITGTPSLVVQGRYLTSGNMALTLDSMLPILDGMIQRVRDTPNL